uniref:Uncharacterized protein n=1 Tax=Romanomermis culicivorax TaxID=13658 RepID=A0A915J468_ROMCU
QLYTDDQEANFIGDNPQPSNSVTIDQTPFNTYQNSNFVPNYSLEEIYEIWRMALPIEDIYVNEKLSRLKSLLRLNGVLRNSYKAYKVRVINNAIIFPRFLSAQESHFDGLDFLPSGLKIIRLTEFSTSVRVELHPNNSEDPKTIDNFK